MSDQNLTTQFTEEELNNEEWRPIVGWEGVYSVSNLGRVRRDNTRQILKQAKTPHGYLRINLKYKSLNKMLFISNIVASAFIGPKPKGLQVNHIDGVKSNNRLENLEYVTDKANKQHAVRIGLIQTGDKSWAHLHHERMAHGKRNGRYISASKRTHCDYGHELGGDNVFPNDKAHGWRRCRACIMIRNKANKHKSP
jgi:hypothetical protein